MFKNFFLREMFFVNRTKKGFTLIELLIVIIIMGVLGAGLLLSSGQAVGAAKAATITTNIAQIKNGAMIYYTDHVNSSDADISDSLRREIRRYVDIAKFNKENENIKYDMTSHGTRKEWTADCDFTNDPDRDDIKNKLLSNKEFYFLEDYLVQVYVFFTGNEDYEDQGRTDMRAYGGRRRESSLRGAVTHSSGSSSGGGNPSDIYSRRNTATSSGYGYGNVRTNNSRQTTNYGNQNLSLYTSRDVSFDNYR